MVGTPGYGYPGLCALWLMDALSEGLPGCRVSRSSQCTAPHMLDIPVPVLQVWGTQGGGRCLVVPSQDSPASHHPCRCQIPH